MIGLRRVRAHADEYAILTIQTNINPNQPTIPIVNISLIKFM